MEEERQRSASLGELLTLWPLRAGIVAQLFLFMKFSPRRVTTTMAARRLPLPLLPEILARQ